MKRLLMPLLLAACAERQPSDPGATPLPDPLLPPAQRVVDVAAGFSSTCALVETGALYCWGENRFGEVADGTDSSRAAPKLVVHDSTFAAVIGTRGSSRVCTLTADGTAYCWGYNQSGELGNGTQSHQFRPVAVAGGLRFKAITTSYHTCAIALDDTAWCWGEGLGGPLGQGGGSQSSFSTPQAVATTVRFRSITTGLQFTCGLDLQGAAYCWGWGAMTGTGASPQALVDTPQPVATSERFVSISAAEEHACALTAAGEAWCWGKVNGPLTTVHSTPLRLDNLPALRQVVGGRVESCVLTTAGRAYCGSLLGDLVEFAPLLRFAGLSAGLDYACGYSTGGAAWCSSRWGFGFLGDGSSSHPIGATVRVAIP